MGKVFNSMVAGVIITVGLALFNGSGISPTSLVNMILNPAGWETSSFWTFFLSIGVAGGVIFFTVGVIMKQDWVWRAGVFGALSSLVVAPYLNLYTFVNAQLSYISVNCVDAPICSALDPIGGIGQFIAVILVGPIFLYALWACVEWIFKGDSF